MDLDPASWGGLELGLKIGPVKTSTLSQGRGNYFELWGKHLPGSKVTPTQNLKLPRFGPLFFGETQFHMQKQTKIKMNDIDSPKLRGRRPHNFQVVGASFPHSPPPPGSRVPALSAHETKHPVCPSCAPSRTSRVVGNLRRPPKTCHGSSESWENGDSEYVIRYAGKIRPFLISIFV